jgi:hypothetical protein
MSNLFNKVINGRQFNFQPIEFNNETAYHVDVKDEDGTRWEFRLFHTTESEVKIESEKLPSWISGLEQELIQAVNEHE